MKKNEKGWPTSITEIKKFIKSMGYQLQIWEEFGDLVGAAIWFGGKVNFGKEFHSREFHIDLNKFGKYAIGIQGSRKKAYLAAAQKAYWFVHKYLKEIKTI